jgi:hypothetical protein
VYYYLPPSAIRQVQLIIFAGDNVSALRHMKRSTPFFKSACHLRCGYRELHIGTDYHLTLFDRAVDALAHWLHLFLQKKPVEGSRRCFFSLTLKNILPSQSDKTQSQECPLRQPNPITISPASLSSLFRFGLEVISTSSDEQNGQSRQG